MHTEPHARPPAEFHVPAAGVYVAHLLAGTRGTADGPEHDRSPVALRVPRECSGRLNIVDTICVWWGNWVAVAATGWGALAVLVPLLLAYVAGSLCLGRAPREATDPDPDALGH